MDQSSLTKIRNFGALKYSEKQICKMLGLFGDDELKFMVEFQDENSPIRQYYEQGVAIGQYNIDAELAKQSEKGDVFSIMELNKRQEQNKLNNLKKELFGI